MRKKRTPEAATLLKVEDFTTLFIAGQRQAEAAPFFCFLHINQCRQPATVAAVHVAAAAAAASVDNYQQQIVRKMPPGHYGC